MKKSDRSYYLRTVGLCATVAAFAAAMPTQAAEQAQDQAGTLQDIIVTAQRRSENLQQTPVAVTAADAEMLSQNRVENIGNVKALTPSVNFSNGYNPSSSPSLQIRGIGTVGSSRSFEGAVGVFVDGVYRSRAGMALSNFLDIESLQILRGPQGTLFGKNTSAGAILLTSVEPEIGVLGGSAEATVGNYHLLTGKGALNLPLGTRAALRLSALGTKNDGYIVDPNSGEPQSNVRKYAFKATLLVEPSDTFKIRLIGDYSRERDICCSATVDHVDGPTAPLIDALTLARGLKLPSSDWRDYEQVLSAKTRQNIVDTGATLLLDFEPAFGGSFHSVTSYRYWKADQDDIDADFSGANIITLDEHFNSRSFSQEITYNGEIAGGTDYVIGAYYAHDKLRVPRAIYWQDQAQTYFDALLSGAGIPPGTASAPTGLFSREDMRGSGSSIAVFTHWNIALTDKLKMIAGARFTREKRRGSFYLPFFTPDPAAVYSVLGLGPSPAYDARTTNKALSGTIGLQYQISPDAMTYMTYSRGFKAGGVNLDPNAAGGVAQNPAVTPGAVPGDPIFKPETVDGVELGLKVDYLAGKARTNVAIFYNKLHNLQVAQYTGLQFAIVNSPSAEAYGVEVENSFKIGSNFTLNTAATWLPKAKYAESAILGFPLSGRRFSSAPKIAASAGLNLDHPLDDDLHLIGQIAGRYQSKVFTNPANNAIQKGYGMLDLNFGVRAEGIGLKLIAWMQNVTDKRVAQFDFNPPFQPAPDSNAYVGAPRTYGITVGFTF